MNIEIVTVKQVFVAFPFPYITAIGFKVRFHFGKVLLSKLNVYNEVLKSKFISLLRTAYYYLFVSDRFKRFPIHTRRMEFRSILNNNNNTKSTHINLFLFSLPDHIARVLQLYGTE